MREIPAALAEHLAGEATNYCHCWRAARRDGAVLGFTDHDEDLAFDDVVYRAATGLDAAEAQCDFGFATGGGEVAGALGSDSMTESDLAAGLWDSAQVEMFLVNWRVPEQRIRLRIGEIGEVRRNGASFTAELRSMAHRLEARQGRLFTATCDVELGDARCGRDVTTPEFRGTGTVASVASRFEIVAGGLDAYENGWFRGGIMHWMSGPNTGRTSEVREHRADGASVRLALWQQPPFPAGPGDAFAVVAGCDKRFETCRDRFANVANFRGFPHMPGTDRALAYAGSDEGNLDGGSLFK
jgi:uncharacterized phage protein (TIGR02218 family)